MTKKDVFVEQLALAEIDATFWTTKLNRSIEHTSDWDKAITNRDDALIRIEACKFLLKREEATPNQGDQQ